MQIAKTLTAEPPKQTIASAPPLTETEKAFGFVQPGEEAQARALVDKLFTELTGRPYQAKACGYFLTLKIYIRPEELIKGKRADGSEYSLYRPDQTAQNDKYQSCTALVVDVGPSAYKGKWPDGSDKFPEGPWCRVGDWVAVPRYEAHLFMYRGVALGMLPDDRVLQVITDPGDILPIQVSDSF